MKPLLISFFILFFITSCRKDPAPPQNNPPAPDSTANDLVHWQKSNSGMRGIQNFYFLSPATGFCAAGSGIYSTQDSGKTWTHVDETGGYDVFFYDPQYGYFVTPSHFGVTTDGGATWRIKSIYESYGTKRVFFTSPSTGFLTTYDGLYKTTDTGSTWSFVNKLKCHGGIYFKNEKEGWVSGDNSAFTGGLSKTTDGGLTFSPVPDVYGLKIYTILFTDSLHGWANGFNSDSHFLVRTLDGGTTWEKVAVEGATDVHFLNNDVGYMVGSTTVSKSTDGGTTWNRMLQVKYPLNLSEVFFVNEHTGWAGDFDGNIYRWKD